MKEGPFTLGSAQFGLAYGLGGARSGLSEEDVWTILEAAISCDIQWIDTARSYGNAEERIGAFMSRRGYRFKIVSKLPSLANVPDDQCVEAVRSQLAESLRALRLEKIETYLTHRPADLLRPAIRKALHDAQTVGFIGTYGASAYTSDEVTSMLEVSELGSFQVPYSVVSNESVKRALVKRAFDRNVLVFARSVFLQGALLMAPNELPNHLRELSAAIVRLRDISDKAGLPLTALLMASARSVPGIFSLVIGVDSPGQLRDLARSANLQPSIEVIKDAFKAGNALPASVIDPRMWPKPV
jgi:aryl-alcohol dehydrogenase-like predicted oxidoreductase